MAANRENGEVDLTVDGTTYTLVLNTAAMVAIEDHCTKADGQLVTWDAFWGRILKGSVTAVTTLLWGMLQKYHPELSYREAMELVDRAGGITGLTSILRAAQGAASPDPEDIKELGVERPSPAQGMRETARRRRRGSGASSTSAPAASA